MLQAALEVIRAKGCSATFVGEVCAAAGVTKGAFFHHFASGEALAVAAVGCRSETTSELFANAPYHPHVDPLARIMGYVDSRAALLDSPVEAFTSLVAAGSVTHLKPYFDLLFQLPAFTAKLRTVRNVD